MERIFVDTGAWIALATAKDPNHQAIVEALASWEGMLVTTNFILAETVTVATVDGGFRQKGFATIPAHAAGRR